jgi:glycosyltransferase involved in cell wall biosynthesis
MLNRIGHSSHFAAADCSLKDEGIQCIGGPVLRFLNRLAVRIERRLSLQSTLPGLGLSLRRELYFHLQLLHSRQFFSMLHLREIADGQRPVVWTVHDPWVTTGHCVHPLDCPRWQIGCGECPDLTTPLAIRRDTTRLNWRIKRWALKGARIHLVVASKWMQQRLRKSPIVAHLPTTLIPFGVDRVVFRPRDKGECRQKLGIPVKARAVGLRWTPWNVLKGTDYAVEALEKLPRGVITHVICFDSSPAWGSESLRGKYEFMHLGWVDNDLAVSTALNAVDLFVMPSIAETFGMMAVEAMACGTPVVVFENTSLPEVVDSPYAGFAVPYKDAGALANAIQTVLQQSELRQCLVDNGLELVAREYTVEKYLERHLELYESLMRRRDWRREDHRTA